MLVTNESGYGIEKYYLWCGNIKLAELCLFGLCIVNRPGIAFGNDLMNIEKVLSLFLFEYDHCSRIVKISRQFSFLTFTWDCVIVTDTVHNYWFVEKRTAAFTTVWCGRCTQTLRLHFLRFISGTALTYPWWSLVKYKLIKSTQGTRKLVTPIFPRQGS